MVARAHAQLSLGSHALISETARKYAAKGHLIASIMNVMMEITLMEMAVTQNAT